MYLASLNVLAYDPKLQVESLKNTLSWAGYESEYLCKNHISVLLGARFDFQRNLLSCERSTGNRRSHFLFGSIRELLGPR
jgi:hypothetical protein